MNKKQTKLLNQKKLSELKVSDSLTNLEEFTRLMTDDIDFNCFDVLSVTRLDTEEPYTRQYTHSHVDTQVHHVSAQSDDIHPLDFAKNKLN